jgi:hypothetical protein
MGNCEVTSVKESMESSLNVVTTVDCPEGPVPDVSNCVWGCCDVVATDTDGSYDVSVNSTELCDNESVVDISGFAVCICWTDCDDWFRSSFDDAADDGVNIDVVSMCVSSEGVPEVYSVCDGRTEASVAWVSSREVPLVGNVESLIGTLFCVEEVDG